MFSKKSIQQLQELRASMYGLKCIIDKSTAILEGNFEGECQLEALAENTLNATVINKLALNQGEQLSNTIAP